MTKLLVNLFAASLSGCSWFLPLRGHYVLVSSKGPNDKEFKPSPFKSEKLEIGSKDMILRMQTSSDCFGTLTFKDLKIDGNQLVFSGKQLEESISCANPGLQKSDGLLVAKYEEVSDGLVITWSNGLTERWKKD